MTKEEVNKIMQSLPLEWRYRWCEAGPCCCLGCANVSGNVKAKGVTKAEWEEWVKDNPEPKKDKYGDYICGIDCDKPSGWTSHSYTEHEWED